MILLRWVLAVSVVSASVQAVLLVPVVPVPGATQTTAFAINGSNHVAGSFIDADGHEHGFFGTPAGDYTTFDAGEGGTQVRGLNQSGVITGFSNSQSGDAGAQPMFEIRNGKILTITRRGAPLFGFAYGNDNAKSTFAGAYWDPVNHRAVAFLGRHGHWISNVTIPEVHQASSARGVNAAFTVVGSFFAPPLHGFVLKGDTLTVVDYPDSHAVATELEAINDGDFAVGQWLDRKGFAHSFLYDVTSGTFTDIKVHGATQVQAWGINNSNVVVLGSDLGPFFWCIKKRGCPVGGTAVDAPMHKGYRSPPNSFISR